MKKKGTDPISIKLLAERLGVSESSVHNWVKTGFIKKEKNGRITAASVEKFMTKVVGKEKLHFGANKKLKDAHNHLELSEKINLLLQTQNPENSGEIYEAGLSDSFKNKEGIYYTPPKIISDMLQGIPIHNTMTFLDPCCGSGNFILEAIRKGIAPENVYGFDTDANAVTITKERIFRETGFRSENIKLGDFLEMAPQWVGVQTFDLIFTNPPWGKKFTKREKISLKKTYNTDISADSSEIFFFVALSLLKEDGYLGFLVQEAFFNIHTFEQTRQKALQYRILRLSDYGKPFKGLFTRAQAMIFQKQTAEPDHQVYCSFGQQHFLRKQISFKKNPKTIFNFWATTTEAEILVYLYQKPHVTLKNQAEWALGVVTGNNKRFCSDIPKVGFVPVVRGADITLEGLQPLTRYISKNFDQMQQVAPLRFYQAPEKLIYKFIASRPVFYYDKESRIVLNSANILLPQKSLGITPQQLTDLLNSELYGWLFQKLFRTHKILRSDLEALPVFVDYFKTHPKFNEGTLLQYLSLHKDPKGYTLLK